MAYNHDVIFFKFKETDSVGFYLVAAEHLVEKFYDFQATLPGSYATTISWHYGKPGALTRAKDYAEDSGQPIKCKYTMVMELHKFLDNMFHQ